MANKNGLSKFNLEEQIPLEKEKEPRVLFSF